MGIQDNLWTAYLLVVVFFALCIFALILVIRFIVKIFRRFNGIIDREYEEESHRS